MGVRRLRCVLFIIDVFIALFFSFHQQNLPTDEDFLPAGPAPGAQRGPGQLAGREGRLAALRQVTSRTELLLQIPLSTAVASCC